MWITKIKIYIQPPVCIGLGTKYETTDLHSQLQKTCGDTLRFHSHLSHCTKKRTIRGEKILHKSDQYEWSGHSYELKTRHSNCAHIRHWGLPWIPTTFRPDRSGMLRNTSTSIYEPLKVHWHSLWRLVHLITSAFGRGGSSTSREVWAAAYNHIGAWPWKLRWVFVNAVC